MSTTVRDSSETVERQRTLVERILAQREFGVVLAVLGLLVIGAIVRSDVFLTLGNMVGVLRNAAVVAIIGYGMTVLITAGEFDLSVGSVMAMAAGITAIMHNDGYSIWFIFVLITILAVLYGIFQGILVTKFGLPSLIVTIGTLTLVRGGHLALLGNVTQTIPGDSTPLGLIALGGTLQLPFPILVPFTGIELFTIPQIAYSIPLIHDSQQVFNSVPLQIFWVVVIGAIFHYLLFRTRFGYRVQATGGNIQAADYTGINTDQIKIAGFVIVALAAAFAGIGQLAFTGNVSPLTGDGTELIVVAAVVIGGTDLFGGEGTISGTVLGSLVFAFTQNILVLAGFGTQLFAIFTGLFIIFAVAVDALTRRVRYESVLSDFVRPVRQLLFAPSEFFAEVDEHVQGVDKPLGFLSMVTIVWFVPTLIVDILTFVPSADGSIIPGEFSLFIVKSGIGAIGTLPLIAFVFMGFVALLMTVFVHVSAATLGADTDFDTSVQAVAYSLAPAVFLFVPASLEGLSFILIVVAATMVPIVLAVLGLLYLAVRQLYDLETSRAAGVVVGTVALWALLWVVFGSQFSL
jgi:ribose/xylose/arabinose/galactoside ABC-type transport system permease subunit